MKWEKVTGVYGIINTETGYPYVGGSVHILRRWSDHRARLRGNRSNQPKLQRSWNKYGENAFAFIILERVDDLSVLREREAYWIGALDAASRKGLNVLSQPGWQGVDARQKIGAARLGKKLSVETRGKMSVSQKARGPRSEETCRRISEARQGKKLSAEHIAAMSRARTGIKLRRTPASIRAKEARRGIPRSAEVKKKISASLMGHSVSPEARLKMGRKQTHCRRGHELTSSNRRKADGSCRSCFNRRQQEARAKAHAR